MDWISKAHELKKKNISFAIASIVNAKGSSPRKPGAKMIVLPTGEIWGTVGGGNGEKRAIQDAIECIKKQENGKFTYALDAKVGQVCGGEVEVYIEVVGSKEKLFILGAGHVAQAIAQVMIDTPFEIHLLDPREEWSKHPELPSSVVSHVVPWENLDQEVEDDCYAVIMTPDHKYDYELVEKLASRKLKFLGVIGSNTKWATFRKRLADGGLSQEQISAIHCPIGVAKAGSAPREVAISLAAQLLILHYQDQSE